MILTTTNKTAFGLKETGYNKRESLVSDKGSVYTLWMFFLEKP